MIAAILSKFVPWLKWWPVPAMAVAYLIGSHHGDIRCEADKAEVLKLQLTGIQDELTRLNGIALSAEAQRAAIEQRNRELQRSLSHEATKALDACPLGVDIVRAINAGRVRSPATEPPR